jgi:hypothetical protein
MTHAYKCFIEIKDADKAHAFLMANVKSKGSANTWCKNWRLKYNKEMKSVARWQPRTEIPETRAMANQTEPEPETQEVATEPEPKTREMETQTELTMELIGQLTEIFDITRGVMARF